jgi:membrane protein required for colicin V production
MILGPADWVIIAVVIFSTVISLWRGATREVLSLATWIIAAWVAIKYSKLLQPLLADYITAPEIQFAVAFAILVVAVLIIGTLLGRAITQFISFAGLAGIDRILGLAFGCARGVLILAIFVLLASFTELPSEPWWEESQLIPHLTHVADYMADWLHTRGYEPFQTNGVDDILHPQPQG